MTKSEIKHAADVLEELIQWSRKVTESEGVYFPGLHPLNNAETTLRFLRLKEEDNL